jgi:hypothetical protein
MKSMPPKRVSQRRDTRAADQNRSFYWRESVGDVSQTEDNRDRTG